MSNRHHGQDELRDRREIDAHRRGERRRIRVGLAQLTGPVADDAVDDLYAPGPSWRPERHHNPERAARSTRDRLAHWKQKAWKRRTASRARRVAIESALR